MSKFKAPFIPGYCYHVFNRSVGKEKMFPWLRNYDYFLLLFHRYISPVADLFCYSLLPNHFHLFLRLKEEEAIREVMVKTGSSSTPGSVDRWVLQRFSNFFNAYTKALNRQQQRKGRLFLESFCRRMVDSPGYYTKLVHYIHFNPVQHGLCRRVEDWPFSSYHVLKVGAGQGIACTEVIGWFGSATAFETFHRAPAAVRTK